MEARTHLRTIISSFDETRSQKDDTSYRRLPALPIRTLLMASQPTNETGHPALGSRTRTRGRNNPL